MSSIQGFCNYGDFVIDVGANRGTYAYVMKKSVGHAGTVVSFEPNQKIYAILKKNLAGSVITENTALSSKQSLVDFFVHKEGAGPSSSLEKFDDLIEKQLVERVKTKTQTLDGYIKAKGLGSKKLALLKIDAEGHDLDVILGAKNTIKNNKPVIIFEFIPAIVERDNYQKLIEFLSPIYHAVIAETGKDFFRMSAMGGDSGKYKKIKGERNFNVICTPKNN